MLLIPVHTFFTIEGGDSEFANFTLPTLKAFLVARSHNLSGNKQFFLWTRDLLVSQKMMQRHFFSTLHPFSTVIFAIAIVLASVLLRDSKFNFHCYTQREATPTQKLARKCAATSRNFLHERLQSAFTLANQLRWIAQCTPSVCYTSTPQLCIPDNRWYTMECNCHPALLRSWVKLTSILDGEGSMQ